MPLLTFGLKEYTIRKEEVTMVKNENLILSRKDKYLAL